MLETRCHFCEEKDARIKMLRDAIKALLHFNHDPTPSEVEEILAELERLARVDPDFHHDEFENLAKLAIALLVTTSEGGK
jgi:hypothetical protein